MNIEITAKDAFEQSVEVVEVHYLDDAIATIHDAIEDAILNGETQTEIKNPVFDKPLIRKFVTKLLTDKGFQTSFYFENNSAVLDINWWQD